MSPDAGVSSLTGEGDCSSDPRTDPSKGEGFSSRMSSIADYIQFSTLGGEDVCGGRKLADVLQCFLITPKSINGLVE